MTSATPAAWLGASLALRRLRGRGLLVVTLSTVVFATMASFAERRIGGSDAASRALLGPVFGLAIPLAMVSLVSLGLGRTSVDAASEPLAQLGASRRATTWGALAGIVLIGAFLSSVTGVLGTLFAHGVRSPGALSDALTVGWIGGLAGVAYVAWFAAASTFGARGGGRLVAFVVDLLLGSMSGFGALPFPRAHAMSLLGGEPVAHLPQAASAGALAGLALIYALITLVRTNR